MRNQTSTHLALRHRGSSGFTMVEVIIVVALIAVLMAVAFVGIFQLRAPLAQTELDATAREIYIAAQNHLYSAYEQDLFGNKGLQLDGKSAETGGEQPAEGDAIESDVVCSFVYYPGVEATDANNPNCATSALRLMLPPASIDETVRIGGSYVINYWPKTGRVKDVFYAKSGGYGSYAFDASTEVNVLEADYAGEDDAKKQARQHYLDTNAVIGWYDGSNEEAVEIKTPATPTVTVVNDDVLEVLVSNPAGATDGNGNALALKLVVEGVQSGAYLVYDLEAGAPAPVVLDNITTERGSFQHVLENATGAVSYSGKYTGGAKFVLGENLKVYAQVTANVLSGVSRSAVSVTNSLFAAGSKGKDGVYRADISCIRHLENLEESISGFDPKLVAEQAGEQADDADVFVPFALAENSVIATQKTDLTWSAFTQTTGAARDPVPGGGSAPTSVFYAVGLTPQPTPEETFFPVSPSYKLVYDGGRHLVTGVDVKSADQGNSAGLFGTLAAAGSEVKDLTLYYCSVDVHDTPGATAGGLVGTLGPGTGVDGCAAASYVSAPGSAGGLVGSASGPVTLMHSYSAGHTLDGSYEFDAAGSAVGLLNGLEAANYRRNVYSTTGAAGGLVGSAVNTDIKYCYSTCSVQGAVLAGGLAGQLSNGSGNTEKNTVENSYCTGFVSLPVSQSGGVKKGAFVAELGESVELGTGTAVNYYLSSINYGTPALGSGSGMVYASDADIDTYVTFASGKGNARPYDGSLTTYYKGAYPYKTIVELDPSVLDGQGAGAGENDDVVRPKPFEGTVGKIIEAMSPQAEDGGQDGQEGQTTQPGTHYGDWPKPETFVNNTAETQSAAGE